MNPNFQLMELWILNIKSVNLMISFAISVSSTWICFIFLCYVIEIRVRFTIVLPNLMTLSELFFLRSSLCSDLLSSLCVVCLFEEIPTNICYQTPVVLSTDKCMISLIFDKHLSLFCLWEYESLILGTFAPFGISSFVHWNLVFILVIEF